MEPELVKLLAMHAGMPPKGHPALFIPGNAGSYQQVCVLAHLYPMLSYGKSA